MTLLSLLGARQCNPDLFPRRYLDALQSRGWRIQGTGEPGVFQIAGTESS